MQEGMAPTAARRCHNHPRLSSLHVFEVVRQPHALGDCDGRHVAHPKDSRRPGVQLPEFCKEEAKATSLLASFACRYVLRLGRRQRHALDALAQPRDGGPSKDKHVAARARPVLLVAGVVGVHVASSSGGGGTGGGRTGPRRGGPGGGQRQQQQRRSKTQSPQQLRSSLYTLATEPPQVAASAQVSASGQVAASCSCRLLSHQTLLWHHRLGHPSLPHLRGMHSCLLVSGLPRSLPPLPPLPAPPCLPCVEGWQRAAPHSSSFPLTIAPLQTLHMDVWGPARVSGQGRECYFLLVVDDYTRYTTVFPLRSKGEDLPVMRLHSDRGGEFSSNLLRDFCRGEGILQSFMLPDSPQQNGIAERRIGLVMEVARTSMIHAAAPHFLWPFAVRYTAHQLNLWPRVSLPETSPTLRWTGEVGNVSVFRVWGSRVFSTPKCPWVTPSCASYSNNSSDNV
ncbi:unnamed protein product [Closterium sp. NIES-53]